MVISMKYIDEKCKVLKNDIIAKETFDMQIFAPKIAQIAKAGQFVNIMCGDKILRRPISICEINGDNVRLVYQTKGEGTIWLSKIKQDDEISVFGPLGKGFIHAMQKKFKEIPQNIVLIGGGIGAPPMLETLKQTGGDVILGFRSKDNVILQSDFKKYCANVQIATDDGSAFTHGFVTDILKENLEKIAYDAILACGPRPMLRAIFEIAQQKSIPCFVSMEERMGCGIGACLVCACKVKMPEYEGYAHVCKSGPVFNAEHIVW